MLNTLLMRTKSRKDDACELDMRVVGHPLAPIGMGEHARSVFRALMAAQQTATFVDIYGPPEKRDADLAREFARFTTSKLGDGVNLFCINGDEVEQALRMLGPRGAGRGYNIIYPAWELERYPEEWAHQLDRFDEIWAPSAFIRDSIAKAAAKPVIHMPLACEVRGAALRSRPYFGIPESPYAFLFFFDFLSYLERKNPFAVIRAFQEVLEREPWPDVALVVKTNNGDRRLDAYERFQQEIEPYKDRVIIIDRTLSDADMKSLISLCDCFISLHRSEGFGRGMSEAMYLGKPVIATAYSGNMDFCNDETALLVDYDLVSVAPDEYPHWEGQFWADPDAGQAAAFMIKLVEHEGWGRMIGRRAQKEIYQNFSYRACGLRYMEHLLSPKEVSSGIQRTSD